MTAARIGASFLLAVFICASLPVFAIYAHALANGYKPDDGVILTLVLLFLVPTIVLGGLLWLPVMIAVRDRSNGWRITAVLSSVVTSGAWFGVVALWIPSKYPPWHWEALIMPSLFMIAFSAIFLWIDRRWGEPLGLTVAVTFALLAAASALTLWLLIGGLWPNGIPQ